MNICAFGSPTGYCDSPDMGGEVIRRVHSESPDMGGEVIRRVHSESPDMGGEVIR